jgi:NADH-quinone oxidoreductase subunit L
MDRCLDLIPWLILALPLAGFTGLAVFGEGIKRDKEQDGAGILASAIVFVAFVLAVIEARCFLHLQGSYHSLVKGALPYQPSLGKAGALHIPGLNPIVVGLPEWISVGGLHVPFSLLIDPLSVVMTLVVTGIGFLIHLYSIGYMAHDEERVRFFSYLNLFTFFMLVLVLGGSLPLMFVGWEGVGLCSYLLIGFWYKKKSASDAGKKAFIVNRIGDVGIILGTILCFHSLGQIHLFDLAQGASARPFEPVGQFGVVTLACLFLFVGACGKSAQIPLHVWLPDAMEGPTPVSALIHAATMVTAGVYMVARLGPLFARSGTALLVIAVVGTATAFMAATIALVQTDIKKVLAYSTVSQLGYMFLACGVGAFSFAVFHLVTHAFFKALLFLGSGSVIHAMSGEQDMRKMGGLRSKIPWTFWTFAIGTAAIAGVPALAGFFSKDKILEAAEASGHEVLFGVGLLTALLTAFYMCRLLFLTFFGEFRGTEEERHHLHESPATMLIPLFVLAIGSVGAGYLPIPEFVGRTVGVLGEEAAAGWGLPIVATIVATLGIVAAFVFYVSSPGVLPRLVAPFGGVRRFLEAKWGFDIVFDWFAEKVVVGGSRNVLWKFFDAGIVDGLVNGLASLVASLARLLRPLQTGLVRNYALAILFGAVALLGLILALPS